MGRFNIYVKDRLLYEELRKRSDVNWSKIACKAFKSTLEEDDEMSDKFMMTAVFNNKTHWYDKDAIHGPMATGAPFWNEREVLRPLTAVQVQEIVNSSGNIGYQTIPEDAILTVYRIQFAKAEEIKVNSDSHELLKKKLQIEAAKAKLTEEERILLGIS